MTGKPTDRIMVAVGFCFALGFSMGLNPVISRTPAQDSLVQDSRFQDSLERDYADQLRRIDPLEIEPAMDSIEINRGLRVDVMASEPLVVDPVAITFDEMGRAYVVEMRGYSEQSDQLLGRVKRLIDRDQDGRFDESTIFADNLRWPTAVVCAWGGILVGDAPDLIYFKDNDNDGRADFRQALFTGFGTSNVQQLPNSLQWGIDNQIYGATGGNGGSLSRLEFPRNSLLGTRPAGDRAIDVRGRDFRINPATFEIDAIAGGTQFGMTFDAWGTRYVCSNSDHCQQIIFEDRYAARNKQQRIQRSRISIAADGPAAEVFRLSPVEPWRKVRTRLRVQGLVRGPIEGGGRAAGYFTSATGICCYDGDLLPTEYSGNLFIGDVGSNLVHRKHLTGEGIQQQAKRVERDSEFLRSSDNWFRPVQIANAPDGSLVVLDMYRETIEHPASLPPLIKKHLDLNSGNQRGRIYRIIPAVPTSPDRRHSRLLPGKASLQELVTMLGHSNGWHRQTAARVLAEKSGDPEHVSAIADLIRSLGLPSDRALARIHSLYLLSTMDCLLEHELATSLVDSHPQVRRHAIRLAESRLTPNLEKQIKGMIHDSDPTVRFQLALTLGEFESDVSENLAALALTDGADMWMQTALASSAHRSRGKVVRQLVRQIVRDESSIDGCRPLLLELASQLSREATDEDLTAITQVLLDWPDDHVVLQGELVAEFVKPAGSRSDKLRTMLQASGVSLDQIVARAVQRAREMALDATLADQQRIAAIDMLRMEQPESIANLIAKLLDLAQAPAIQRSAIELATYFDSDEIGEAILARFRTVNPNVRAGALQALLARDNWVRQLLGHVESGKINPVLIDAASRQRLIRHRSGEVRTAAERLFGSSLNPDRKKLVQRYLNQVDPAMGDINRGRNLFRTRCAACHRLENEGNEIGPNLAAFANRGTAAMITNILDPNREVDPQFLAYQVQLEDGRHLLGMIASETSTTISLRDPEGNPITILRSEIDAMQSTALSLMPENFENEIHPQAMADLLKYLLEQGS